MSIDTAELEGGRRTAPSCLAFSTAINADRLGQEELAERAPRTPTSANLGSSQPHSS